MVKKCKKSKSARPIYRTDPMAANIWRSLARDFRVFEGNDFAVKAENQLNVSVADFRDYDFPELGEIDPFRFKCWTQLKDLLKKYRFSADKYTDAELTDLTIRNNFADQERISVQPPITELVYRVLNLARKKASAILGRYDPEMTVTLGRFGKKSSVGCPLSLAYIDEKLSSADKFTSSTECANWFIENVIKDDKILLKLASEYNLCIPGAENLACEFQNLVNVPKSWKTERPITPLALLDLFYSYGVGEQVTAALKDVGLDIGSLQSKHRRLVEEASVNRKLTTADLKSASQSLTSWLLNRTLPREWFCAMKKTFHHELRLEHDDQTFSTFYSESVLPMGNGLTFPTETLVFYVLLKAIAELAGVRGLISVYGDDLIYPTALHKYVVVIFPQLNLLLNADKTFSKAHFRESCGSDFYHGVDVRPAFLPGRIKTTSTLKYSTWLYKVINALRRRWDDECIPTTLALLFGEINRVGEEILRVPPSFPDTSGIKVHSPGLIILEYGNFAWGPTAVRFAAGTRHYCFTFLNEAFRRRVVKDILPHYWLALRGETDAIELVDPWENFWDTDFSYYETAPRSSLTWSALKRVRFYRNASGKRVRKTMKKWRCHSPSRVHLSLKRVVVDWEKDRDSNLVSDWV